jgi:hypothetical protein
LRKVEKGIITVRKAILINGNGFLGIGNELKGTRFFALKEVPPKN